VTDLDDVNIKIKVSFGSTEQGYEGIRSINHHWQGITVSPPCSIMSRARQGRAVSDIKNRRSRYREVR